MTASKTISFSALSAAPEGELLIISLEGDIYAIYLRQKAQQAVVLNEKGESMTFRSLGAAKKALAPLPFSSALLIHTSAYDEMIGQPMKGDNRLTINISLTSEEPS